MRLFSGHKIIYSGLRGVEVPLKELKNLVANREVFNGADKQVKQDELSEKTEQQKAVLKLELDGEDVAQKKQTIRRP